MPYGCTDMSLIDCSKAFWNDFPSGKMDKACFIKYYDEIKDERDQTNVLCEWVVKRITLLKWSVLFLFSHVFAAFDQDHNGTIDFHEFLFAVTIVAPHDIDSRLDHAFEM